MITDARNYYKPFEYQTAFDFYKDQHRAHWLADEVPLASDLNDWKLKLADYTDFMETDDMIASHKEYEPSFIEKKLFIGGD